MKKKIAVLLALTLTVGCIGTGCGEKKADADTAKKDDAEVKTEEVTTEENILSGTHAAVVGSTLTAGNGTTSYTDYLEKKNDMTVDVVDLDRRWGQFLYGTFAGHGCRCII